MLKTWGMQNKVEPNWIYHAYVQDGCHIIKIMYNIMK